MEPLIILSLFTFCVAIGSRSIHAKRIWHWFQQHQTSRSTIITTKSHNSSLPPPRSQPPTPEKQQPIHTLQPYVFPALAPKTASKSSMGLKRLDVANWLSIDRHYHSEHDIRTQLLATNHPNVIQVLPGSELACHEVLSLTVTFLTTRYPQHFTITSSPSTSTSQPSPHQTHQFITNHLTKETFQVGPSCPNPLETAARLAMEDFNVLMKNEEGEYCLLASATLFPAGWKLRERVGMSMAVLHAPVPGWKDRLSGSVSRYFDHLKPSTAMERTNLFIQTSPDLFVDEPEAPRSSITPDELWVRRERQIFRRLEKSGAVLFTVRTFMRKCVDLKNDCEEESGELKGGWIGGEGEVEALKQQVGSWEGQIKDYKGYGVWGGAYEEWCAGMEK